MTINIINMNDFITLTSQMKPTVQFWGDWDFFTTPSGKAYFQTYRQPGFQRIRYCLQDSTTTIKCSLHHLYNCIFNGLPKTNYNQFRQIDLLDTINYIEDLTTIDAEDFRVSSYEFGLNIPLPMNVEELFANNLIDFLDYKDHCAPIYSKFSMYKFNTSNKVYKFYDKGAQVRLNKPTFSEQILRIEARFKNHRTISNQIGINTLEDLAKKEVWEKQFEVLLKMLERLVILDDPDDHPTLSNPKFWYKIRKDNSSAGRKRKQRLVSELSFSNIKDEIRQKMEQVYFALITTSQ